MNLKRILISLLAIIAGLIITVYVVNSFIVARVNDNVAESPHYKDGQFVNTKMEQNEEAKFGLKNFLNTLKRRRNRDRTGALPAKPLPIQAITRAQLEALSNDELHIAKLGHSSILLKVYGKYWLLDPMFSERASPVNFAGPQRYQDTPIKLDELPSIERVLVSHNHYDHLDKASVQALAAKTKMFLVPLGVEGDLEKWGVDKSKITHFDWWQELQTEDALVAFTPTQHFSGRGLSDRNATLWGSWVIKAGESSLYFSGDSGYFAGFKAIGEKYGPFDLTMVETGAYGENWNDIHMFPEESVQAHIDLRGVTMLPIHNSTFDLSLHTWYDPLERVSLAATKQKVTITTPIVGEFFTPTQSAIGKKWWQAYR
jgi:L-ascorbate metabolism protein UlaG (beta-lactamase superfamily)